MKKMGDSSNIRRESNLKDREKDEAEMFDGEVLHELGVRSFEDIKDKDLLLSNERISMHLRFTAPPNRGYRYALYRLQNLNGKKVLDFCAGTGETSVIIAKKGPMEVEAFDISPLAVKIAKKRMKINNVDNIVNMQIMSAYSLNYPDNHFDYVYGNAVLHHLDLNIAMKEIHRVLKTGGRAIFCEPFAGSSVLQFIRKLVPVKVELSPHERQLTIDDIKIICAGYSKTHLHFIELFSRLDRIIKYQIIIDCIADFDHLLLNFLPFLRKYSRSFVVECTK